MKPPITVPPRQRKEEPHPLDPTIAALTVLAEAIHAQSREFCEALGGVSESMNALGGRLDGQSRAMQDLADENRALIAKVSSFVDDKDALRGRVIMLEEIERERREANGHQ